MSVSLSADDITRANAEVINELTAMGLTAEDIAEAEREHHAMRRRAGGGSNVAEDGSVGRRLDETAAAEISSYEASLAAWWEQRKAAHPTATVAGHITSESGKSSRAVAAAMAPSPTATSLNNKAGCFTFQSLIQHALPPEVAAQGSEAAADALLAIETLQLDSVGMTDSGVLECLTNVTHLQLRDNLLTSLEGLEFMLRLRSLNLRGNKITTLQPLALLPIETLDVSSNRLGDLERDVLPFLPFETMTVLHLCDNPCSPGRADSDNLSLPVVLAYRKALLAANPMLVALDGLAATPLERTSYGLPAHPGGELDDGRDGSGSSSEGDPKEEGEEPTTAGERREGRLETNFRESDFTEDGVPAEEALVATPAKRKGGRDGGGPEVAIADGVVSTVHAMTTDLLKRYQKQCAAKDDVVAGALTDAVDITDEGEDALQQAQDGQKELRNELRFAQQHHNRLAQAQMTATWDEAENAMASRREATLDRRILRKQELGCGQPSAAYARALETLRQEAGGSLERFRKPIASQATSATVPTPPQTLCLKEKTEEIE